MPRGKRAGAPTKPKQTGPKKKNGKPEEKKVAEAKAKPARAARPAVVDLAEDEWAALFHNNLNIYENLLAIEATAVANRRNFLKRAKGEGFTKADLDDGLSMRDDGEAAEQKMRQEFDRKLRIARWMALPIGIQGSFLDEPNRIPAIDQAFADGKRAAMAGEPRKPPHDPSVPQYGSWMNGYGAGQDVLMKGFKPMAPTEGYSDGQPAANAAPDGAPVGSVLVDEPATEEPITSGETMTRSEWNEHMRRQAEEADAKIRQQSIGSEPASYQVN